MLRGGLLLLFLTSCAAPAILPTEEHWYAMSGPLDSWMLHLRPDGQFQTLFATHFTVEEGLTGTWRLEGSQGATLRCDRWSRMIVLGSLRVRFGKDWASQRPKIARGLVRFLQRTPGATFTKAEFEEAVTWEEPRTVGTAKVMPLSTVAEMVSRADVDRLIPLVDAYGSTGDPREVHVWFQRRGTVDYLDWVDWSGYTDPLTPDQIHARIDAAPPGGAVPDVWVKLPLEEVRRRLSTEDGLRYFK